MGRKMMEKKILTTALAALSVGVACAQTTAPQEQPAAPQEQHVASVAQVQEQQVAPVAQNQQQDIVNTNDLAKPSPTVHQILDKKYQEWLKEASAKTLKACRAMGRDLRSPACNLPKNIVVGKATVAVPKTHPNWVEARQMAYMNAMNNAFSTYAQQQKVNNQTKILSRMLRDDAKLQAPSDKIVTDNFDDAKPGKVKQLFDKVCALGEAMIDKKLGELGVPPEKYERQPIEVKKKQLENSIEMLSEFTTHAETAGMVPLQTFYGEDEDGRYGIRVVFATAPSRIRLVHQMLKDGANIPPNPALATDELADTMFVLPEEQLFDMLGTRLVYDESGYPTLFAFGQAGVGVPRNNPTFGDRYEIAQSDANANAMNALTLLLNATTNVKRVGTTKAGTETNQTMTVDAKNNATFGSETTGYAGSFSDMTIDTSGRIRDFEGIRTVHTWSHFDSGSQQYVVGAVLMWSPATAQYIQEQKQALREPVNAAPAQEQQTQQPKYEAKARKAKETDNYVF